MNYEKYLELSILIENYEKMLSEKAKYIAIILKNGEIPDRATDHVVDFRENFAYFYWVNNKYGDNDIVSVVIEIPVRMFEIQLEDLKFEATVLKNKFENEKISKDTIRKQNELRILELKEKKELQRLKEKYEKQ